MSSSSMSTVPRPGPSVLLSFTLKLPSRYPLPQTGVRPEVVGQRWVLRSQRRRRRRAGLVLATGHHLVMLSAPSDGGPPGGRRKALGVSVALALSAVGWSPSLGVPPSCFPLPQTGVRPEVAERHWASWLQRRRRRHTGPAFIIGYSPVMLPTPSDGGPPGGRRTALGVVVAAASPVAHRAVSVIGQHPVMLSTPSDGGPPGGRRTAPGVVVPAASSVVYWAGLRRRVFLRHAIHSLRRGSARRSQNSSGRRRCSGVLGHALAWWPVGRPRRRREGRTRR